MMFEGFDSDCSASAIDDITITRFGGTYSDNACFIQIPQFTPDSGPLMTCLLAGAGSDDAAAHINSHANANIDILFSATFEDRVPAGTGEYTTNLQLLIKFAPFFPSDRWLVFTAPRGWSGAFSSPFVVFLGPVRIHFPP